MWNTPEVLTRTALSGPYASLGRKAGIADGVGFGLLGRHNCWRLKSKVQVQHVLQYMCQPGFFTDPAT